MTIEIRADYFSFIPTHGTGEDAARGIARWVSKNEEEFIDRTFGHHTYRLADLDWTPQAGRLSGVMYKHVDTNLPSTLSDDGETPVPIDPEDSLGDPVCFCYYPKLSAAIIQFNQIGARHSTLRQFLTEIGAPSPFVTDPILTDDAMERLRDTQIVRSFEYSLQGIDPASDLQNMGEGVGGALSILRETKGVNIHVTVSVGRASQDRGLASKVKSMLRSLAGEDGTSTLKLRGKPGVDDAVEEIDLLRDRLWEFLDIEEDGRQIDTGHCVRQLASAFSRKKAYIEKRIRAQTKSR